ncbi:MAG: hypothetical protein AB1649_32930 [Chloroflexota bacterium]
MAKLLNDEGKIFKEMDILKMGCDNHDSDDFDRLLTIVTSRKELKTMCDRLMGAGDPSPWLGLFHYIQLEYLTDQTTTWGKTDLLAAAYTKYYINECDTIKIRRGDLFFMTVSFLALLGASPMHLSPQAFWECVDLFKEGGWQSAAAHLLHGQEIEGRGLRDSSSITEEEMKLPAKTFAHGSGN